MTSLITPDYQAFIQNKRLYAEPTGIDVLPDTLHSSLKPHQRHTAVWALKQGRAAVFFDRGLGKTRLGIEFGRALIHAHLQLKGFRVLIICPLAVVEEFLEEGHEINYLPKYAPDQSVVKRTRGIWLTNFERADRFDASQFDAVIIDEASILKSLDSKTRIGLTKQWRNTKYKLLLTATPSPNDVKELVNYSEFLGIMSRKEVFATFFINETGKKKQLVTRLKHHAVGPFYQWLSSWAIAARKPSDLGFDNTGYDLPSLNITEQEIESGWVNKGQLVYTKLAGVTERADVRKATMSVRVQKALESVQSHNEQAIIWHHLNDEGYQLRDALLSDCVLVEGAMSAEAKAEAFKRFKQGDVRVLITKSSIGGFGVNFQNAHRQVWVGINDSFEEFYQAIGRQHRFGQQHPVQVDVILADAQRPIWENVLRKKDEHEKMIAQLVDHMGGTAQLNRQRHDYRTDFAAGEKWKLHLGDSCDPQGAMSQIEDNTIGLSVHSPPFVNRYAYSATERDLGNSRDMGEFMGHYRFQIRELLRVTMPGRSACVHVQNVRTTKRDTDTHPGLMDFRGEVIRAFVAEGWVWVHEITVDKNAQMQAKRKHHQGLLYKTKNTDSSKLTGALADYLLVFRKPGDNTEPIDCDVPDDVWNGWARPVWYDINEIDVLDTQVAAADDDEMHLCPLQKPFIERCIRLWSNKGDLILDPFNGISSTGYVAIQHNRRYVGIELKPNYFVTGVKNLIEAERKMRQVDLFKWAGLEVDDVPAINVPQFELVSESLLNVEDKADSPVSESLMS
jgi:DNA modification methylase